MAVSLENRGVSFATHCAIGLAIRLCLVVYAHFHDQIFAVPYTDVDYRVYTDASRLIVNGQSPFDRHTYRYTPFLAALLTPNIFLHVDFGKIVFSLSDVLVTYLIRNILREGNCPGGRAEKFALAWLYNPLTIAISTRGNADSLAALFVLSSLYALMKNNCIVSGLFHGLSIHYRLYPIAFSLSMFLSLSTGRKFHFWPNKRQIKLVLACLLSLVATTSIAYYFYGYKYCYESMIYHLIRKDARHNFSVFFYMTYLSSGLEVNFLKRFVSFAPQLVVLVAISFRFPGKKDLPFAILAQAIVMVAYNPVMTSQYFFWFLSVLPICLPSIRITWRRWTVLTILWLAAQALWLFQAYLLEFQGRNTFYRIWLVGIVFFIVNVAILRDLIEHYDSEKLTTVAINENSRVART